MRKLASEFLAVYFLAINFVRADTLSKISRTDSCSGEEPKFHAALGEFYTDVIRFAGALQFISGFMAQ